MGGRGRGRRGLGGRHRLRAIGRRQPQADARAVGHRGAGHDRHRRSRRRTGDPHPPALRPRGRLRPVPHCPLPPPGRGDELRHRPAHDPPGDRPLVHRRPHRRTGPRRVRRPRGVPRRRRRAGPRPLDSSHRRAHERVAGRAGLDGSRLAGAGVGCEPLLREHDHRPAVPDRLRPRPDARRSPPLLRPRQRSRARRPRPRPPRPGALPPRPAPGWKASPPASPETSGWPWIRGWRWRDRGIRRTSPEPQPV